MRTAWYVNMAALVTFIGFVVVLPSFSAVESGLKIEGMIDIDYPHADQTKVEVNLEGNLISVAAKIVKDKDPVASELLGNLQVIKVRIYNKSALKGKTVDEVLNFYEEQLKKEKWDVPARVREEGSKVGLYLLTKGDIISGLVALIGKPEEVVIVNLAGKIDVTKIPKIAEITGVKVDLKELNIKKHQLEKEKQELHKERESLKKKEAKEKHQKEKEQEDQEKREPEGN